MYWILSIAKTSCRTNWKKRHLFWTNKLDKTAFLGKSSRTLKVVTVDLLSAGDYMTIKYSIFWLEIEQTSWWKRIEIGQTRWYRQTKPEILRKHGKYGWQLGHGWVLTAGTADALMIMRGHHYWPVTVYRACWRYWSGLILLLFKLPTYLLTLVEECWQLNPKQSISQWGTCSYFCRGST